jgi:chromosomal replication initiation ATPase DnaA
MMRDHFEHAAAQFGLTLHEVRSPARTAKHCRAREIAYKACRDAGYTLTQIGNYVRRDHTSVLNGLRNIERRAFKDDVPMPIFRSCRAK